MLPSILDFRSCLLKDFASYIPVIVCFQQVYHQETFLHWRNQLKANNVVLDLGWSWNFTSKNYFSVRIYKKRHIHCLQKICLACILNLCWQLCIWSCSYNIHVHALKLFSQNRFIDLLRLVVCKFMWISNTSRVLELFDGWEVLRNCTEVLTCADTTRSQRQPFLSVGTAQLYSSSSDLCSSFFKFVQ